MSKIANAIIVGGPIAVGKSTLAGSLELPTVQELDQNDELQNILLRKMYEKHEFAPQIFQLDLMLSRFAKYKKIVKTNVLHIFDRSIFEDRLFAEIHLANDKPVLEYYLSIWNDKVTEMTNEIGIPKLYILLTCSWNTFHERIFIRNRKSEISNFSANEEFFRKMIDMYESYMSNILNEYKIPFIKINTDNIGKLELIEITKKNLIQKGLKLW